jgi:phage tail-like protein
MAEQEIYRNYGFFIELQGERAGYFTKVTGLGLEVEKIEYREGGVAANVRKLPGRTTINDITLEQGLTLSDTMWRWIDTAVQGKVEPRNVSIVALGPDMRTEVVRWNMTNAWPCEVKVADFDAVGNEVLIVSMTLTAETLERAASGGTA